MSLWKREEVQEVPRRGGLIRLLVAAAASAALAAPQGGNQADALWREYGLEAKTTAQIAKATATVYRMRDLTGAVAAWEWLRNPEAKSCTLEPFCTADGQRTVVESANYVVVVDGKIAKPQLDEFLNKLPQRNDGSLPAILTYIPRQNLIPNSAKYVLGPESLNAFAPQLSDTHPGFSEGAEAQVAEYKSGSSAPTRLAIFYYPTPELARLHFAPFQELPDAKVKRSDVLLAVVFGGATERQADVLLSRIEFEGRVTWNETPPPSPIKPLYQLLRNIIFMSLVLIALCFMAGLIYAGIRLYRRRFGSLEEDEAMTTLHLSGE